MRYFVLLCLIIFFQNTFSQNAKEDSVLFYQQLDDLLKQEQYATTHLLLIDRLQQVGMKSELVCRLVHNALNNYYDHENYEIFYLRNSNNVPTHEIGDTLDAVKVAKLRHPTRWLQRKINLNEKSGWAKKLLGDYYRIQLEDVNNSNLVSDEKKLDLREKVFNYYSQAEQLNYRDISLNRWLGTYHFKTNQLEKAKTYFLKTLELNENDPLALLNMAKISSQNNLFTETFNYAQSAIQQLSKENTILQYQAVLLAAESLRELGEIKKFLNYTNQAIHLIPDEQTAYLALYHFYLNQNDTEKAENILAQMLMENPFDLKGFRVIESYILEKESFYFGDKLFDQMLMKYENWDEVMANIYWSKGNLAYRQGLTLEAKKFWDISRNYMRNYLPEDNSLIDQVGSIMENNK